MVTSFLEMVGYTYVMSVHKYHRFPCNWNAWTPEIGYNVLFFSIHHTDQTHPCIPARELFRISVKGNWGSNQSTMEFYPLKSASFRYIPLIHIFCTIPCILSAWRDTQNALVCNSQEWFLQTSYKIRDNPHIHNLFICQISVGHET